MGTSEGFSTTLGVILAIAVVVFLLVILACGGVVFFLGAVGSSVDSTFEEVAVELEPTSTVAPEPQASPSWASNEEALSFGDISVTVSDATVGHVPLHDSILNSEGLSENKLLMLRVRLTNNSETRKINYNTWRGESFDIDGAATATDEFGNRYRRVGFGLSDYPKGAIESFESIYPGKSIDDVLVFEVPIDRARKIRLKLPKQAIGGSYGDLRFEIPIIRDKAEEN